MYSHDGVWKRCVNAYLRAQEGVAAMELAFFAAIMAFVVPLAIDIANVVNAYISLSGALRAGAQYALTQPSNTSQIQQIVQNASAFGSGATVSSAQFCECTGISATCATACPGSGSSPYTYLTITASYNVPTLINYPGVASPYPISRSTTIRVR